MFCSKCGTQLPENATVCTKCGTLVAKPFDPATSKHPASTGQRLANLIVDRIVSFLLGIIIGFILFRLGMHTAAFFLTLLIYLLYYIFFEGIWQRTPGKWVTKTKVVRLDGGKPTFMEILGRSFSRFIPFEPFSLLAGAYPMGWHDTLPGTLVVPSSYTAEDVKNINIAEVERIRSKSIVIVIIVILFAVMMIGSLSAVLLASLNTARNKAGDARAEATLANIRSQAELYSMGRANHGAGSDYSGFCADPSTQSLLADVKNLKNIPPVCNDSTDSYAATAAISTGKYYCVDSAGFKGEVTATLASRETQCPAM